MLHKFTDYFLAKQILYELLSMKATRSTNGKIISKKDSLTTENNDDEKLYAYLVKEIPDGKNILTDKEKRAFENRLGV